MMSTIPTLVVPFVLDKTKRANPFLVQFMSALKDARERSGAVYRTEVEGDENERFAFLTTSKDTHLGLGMLTRAGQYTMAKMLEHEFRYGPASKTGQIMLTLEKGRKKNGKEESYSALINVLTQNNLTTYTVSPAH